eukprot:TRINITY_DN5122_c0_g1_i1.p1 TRINITY_DN5122_c0_g1~~TRINITY_DN5122_c0_g1_i1.p1  ORF type:complete len:300 (-),score=90.82 TRINITY_DN5122_c0_g1_i1:46-945(-)
MKIIIIKIVLTAVREFIKHIGLRASLLLGTQYEYERLGEQRPHKTFFDCLFLIFAIQQINLCIKAFLLALVEPVSYKVFNYLKKSKYSTKIKGLHLPGDSKSKDSKNSKDSKQHSINFSKLLLKLSWAVFFFPVEYAKFKIFSNAIAYDSNGNGVRQYEGVFDVWKTAIDNENYLSIYEGLIATLVKISVHYLIMEFSIKMLMKFVKCDKSQIKDISHMIALIFSYPFLILGARVIVSSGSHVEYKTSFYAFITIFNNEPFVNFYDGFLFLITSTTIALLISYIIEKILYKLLVKEKSD